jgi:hypothetical protein
MLFIVGICEDFINMLYYRTAAKDLNGICAFFSLIRGLLWVFVITTLIKHTEGSPFIAISYVCGCACGTYFSLKVEPILEKYLKVLKKKGRRVKRWFLKHTKRR